MMISSRNSQYFFERFGIMAKSSKSRRKKGGSAPVTPRQTIVHEISQATNETIVPEKMRTPKISHFFIDVVKKVQKGVAYYSGDMSLAELAALTHVDNYDGECADVAGKGQRALCETRGKQFMNFIADRDNLCFMEILLNEREKEITFTSLKQMGISVPQYDKLSAMHGVLEIPISVRLYVYDGQTRRFGYLSLLHFDLDMLGTDAYKSFKHMRVPFCLCQVSAGQETTLFLHHNKQTSVPNDHKAMVSWHANKSSSQVKTDSYSEKTSSVIAGMTFMMDRDRTNPWYGRIGMPDLPKEENKLRLGTQGSFNTGLKRFVGWLNNQYWSPETSYEEKSQDLKEICTVFWRSVQKVCPKIWRTPEDYIQLKSFGIATLSLLMHTLYIDFFDRDIEWTIDNIHKHLKKSKIITTPKMWECGGELSKRGGNYKSLQSLERDIYDQIRRN